MSAKRWRLQLVLAVKSLIVSAFIVLTCPLQAVTLPQPTNTKSWQFASSEYLPHYGPNLPKQGAVVEIVRQAFANRGIQIQVSFLPFARAFYDTQQGHYQGIIAIWQTDERQQHFLFSEPIYHNEIVLLKRAGEFAHLTTPSAILNSDGTLGLVTGYAQSSLIVNSKMHKVSVATDEQIIKMLAMKRVDLVPTDKLNGLALYAQLPATLRQTELTWLEPALELKPMYLGFPKSHPDSVFLLNEFNLGLKSLHENGDFQRILNALLPTPILLTQ